MLELKLVVLYQRYIKLCALVHVCDEHIEYVDMLIWFSLKNLAFMQ